MTVTAASFVADFPEFSNSTKYPAASITWWITLAYQLLDASTWGSVLDQGVELYVAHNMALEGQQQAAGASGGTPGQNSGPLSSKSVGPVSAGYDTGSASIEGGGDFNLTTYGTRFLKLARMFGAGGIQI